MPRRPRQNLITFNLEPDKWERFQALCEQNNTSAEAELVKWIEERLAGEALPEAEISIPDGLRARLEAIEARLAVLEGKPVPNPPKPSPPPRKPGLLSLPTFPPP